MFTATGYCSTTAVDSSGAWSMTLSAVGEGSHTYTANPDDASFSLSTNVPAGTENPDALTTSKNICDKAGNCNPSPRRNQYD